MEGKRSRQAGIRLIGGVGLMLMACTSARETNEYNAAVPSTIQSDADRRAIYNNAAATNPISRPPNLNNQASEINRQKRIENNNPNTPNNDPLEVRTMQLQKTLPDTAR